MTEEQYETAYLHIKNQVMTEWCLLEEDMAEDGTEDDVNRETDARFFNQFGIEYLDI